MNGEAQRLHDEIHELLVSAEFDQLIAIGKQHLRHARSIGDRPLEATALIAWAQAHKYLGKFKDAQVFADAALLIAEEINHSKIAFMALMAKGSIQLISTFQYHESEADYQQALRVAVGEDNEYQMAGALQGLAYVYYKLGQYKRAHKYAYESLLIARENKDHATIAAALNTAGMILNKQGQQDRALQAYQDGLALCEQYGFRLLRAQIIGNLGELFTQSQRYLDKGLRLIERSLELAEEIDCVPFMFAAIETMGEVFERYQQWDAAQSQYEVLIQHGQMWQNRTYIASGLNHLGRMVLHQNIPEVAVRYLHEAHSIHVELMNPFLQAQDDLALYQAYSQMRQYDDALTHLLSAQDLFKQLDDQQRARRLWLPVVRTYIASIIWRILRGIGIDPSSYDDRD